MKERPAGGFPDGGPPDGAGVRSPDGRVPDGADAIVLLDPVDRLFGEPAGTDGAFNGVHLATDLADVVMLKHNRLFLLTDPFGDIPPDGRSLGLYHGDTRFLSRYELRIDGTRPAIVRTGTGGSYSSTIQLSRPEQVRDGGQTLEADPESSDQWAEITRSRLLAGGFRERISVCNLLPRARHVALELKVDADYADIFEVRGLVREQRGQRLPTRASPQGAAYAYRGVDGGLRRTHLRLSQPAQVTDDGRTLRLACLLDAGESWTVEVSIWTETIAPDEAVQPPATGIAASGPGGLPVKSSASAWSLPPIDEAEPASAHCAWAARSTAVLTSHPALSRSLHRALTDLRVLVNPGPRDGERYIAAGIPWFSALFGRDSLITSLQLLSVRPDVAAQTLQILGRLQAHEIDDWRDAQPGKILHELRTGELARTGEIPHTPYYGTVDATPLWLILLGEYERWTADRALVDRLWPNALAALDWIDRHGDIDGDGFVEYLRRSDRGLANQGWKDSVEANRYRDGRLARGPLALVEVQAYVFAARLAVARLARLRGEEAFALHQEAAAAQLRDRFEAAFWMEDAGTYALALDADKRQVDAVGSNAGHALWCGIASPERAERVARSLTGPDLWSGWGIRTLSERMTGYDASGYHIGSIWPHDNATIAAGLARYGLRREATRIWGALLEVAAALPDAGLPELFCGFTRGESLVPVPYPVACQPQAWAAGALFQVIGSMLGLEPDASRGMLEVRFPVLPEWLSDIRLENLRVGAATIDLGFSRTGASTSVRELRRVGDLAVAIHA
ncbi:amylo-alpha-1,6-glucosidase [soil metagenome]